ncbi:MAG: insulinase family protein [Planctomycetes bacterium]|nr:insulinase family protein [Planctomycetota bacterium]
MNEALRTTVTPPPSFVHFQLPGDFRLAVNSNRKMKTILVTVTVLGNLDETVTRMALLPMVLRRGTRRFKDMQAISRHLEGLYGTVLASYVQKVGEWHAVRFRLDVVNERFLPGESGVFRRALELLRELLWEPLEVGGGFEPAYLEQEKANLRRSIESLVDNKAAYAEHRLIEEMCRGEPYRLHEQGRVEDIPEIDGRSLRALHRRWAEEYPLHAHVAGDVDVQVARDLVADVFSSGGAARKGGYTLAGIPAPVPVGPVREVVERMDVNQAKLALGFRHGITYSDPAYEALLLMNGILGGFSHSKLFQNVREKASLAYSVHSGLDRTKGLLFISSGIAPENHRRVVEIVLEHVQAIRDGDVTDDEIQTTLLTILNANEMLEDNFAALADVDFTWGLHGRPLDLVAFRERLRRVGRDDIVEAARRLRHDTTYLLTR